MTQTLKTVFLLALLNAIFLFVGNFVSGAVGLVFALIFSLLMNFAVYFYSEKVVLNAYKARPLDPEKYADIHNVVAELAASAKVKKPKLWIANMGVANAFATGRNPDHSSIVLTPEIISLLDQHELRAVLAHEMSHITNRDILIMTTVAVIASAISFFPDLLRFQLYFGDRKRSSKNSANFEFLVYMLILILVPIATMILQLAISRAREFQADESGAKLSHSPLDLASALRKIENYSKQGDFYMNENESGLRANIAKSFFACPFRPETKESWGSWFVGWFLSHPPTKDRIKKLENLRL